ncbi:hypothetical protein HDV06_006158 [Boothiomyces sp. JEL0866]|nr:hypothetical protein HDV06_006158 [Boothiomyces sp. JEL0866]
MIFAAVLLSAVFGQSADPIYDAFTYSLPVGEWMKFKLRLYTAYPGSYNGVALNQPINPNENFSAVIGPSVDTVYAFSVLDLAASPRLITIPSPEGRYTVSQFSDPYGNSPISITSLEYPQGGKFLWYGPDTSDDEAQQLANQSSAVLVKFNTTEGVACFRAIHNQTDSNAAADYLTSITAVRTKSGVDELMSTNVGNIMKQMGELGLTLANVKMNANQYALSTQNSVVAWSWAILGMKSVNPATKQEEEDREKFQFVFEEAQRNATFMQDIAAKVPGFMKIYAANVINIGTKFPTGWSDTDSPIVGAFGDNYLLRAATALAGYEINPPYIVRYFVATNEVATGQVLDGTNNYSITFTQPPPVDGFWSITAYYGLGDQRYGFLMGNTLQKYSVGDRTPGLIYNPDGSLTINLSSQQPSDTAQLPNWLPITTGRSFELILRVYSPRLEINSWVPPAVIRN